MPPIKFKLTQTYHSGADVIWRFSRWLPWWPFLISNWNHLSNSKSPRMPSTKFPLHPTYCSGADNNWRLSRWPLRMPTWIWFWWRCLKCEKLLTDIRMRDGSWSTDYSRSSRWANNRRSIEDLIKNAAAAAIVDIVTKCFQQFWISMSPQCLLPSFGSIWFTIREQMRFEDFQDGQISDQNNFSNPKSLRCRQSSFGSIRIMVWEMSFEEFQS